VVDNGYEREFQYVYGAVSPREGELDWRIGPVTGMGKAGQKKDCNAMPFYIGVLGY
jgi:hypothetical protein